MSVLYQSTSLLTFLNAEYPYELQDNVVNLPYISISTIKVQRLIYKLPCLDKVNMVKVIYKDEQNRLYKKTTTLFLCFR